MPEKDFYQISLKAIVRNTNGSVLAMKCVPTSSMAGFYELPGGRIDKNEFQAPFENMVRRELREELGSGVKFTLRSVPVALGRHLIPARNSGQLQHDVHVLLVFFEADYLGGEIKISNEHDGYAWIHVQTVDLKKYFTSGTLEGIQMYVSHSREPRSNSTDPTGQVGE